MIVRFKGDIDITWINDPYPSVYGIHPSCIVFTGPVGSTDAKMVSHPSDPCAGKSDSVMGKRMGGKMLDSNYKEERLREALQDGAIWEHSTG